MRKKKNPKMVAAGRKAARTRKLNQGRGKVPSRTVQRGSKSSIKQFKGSKGNRCPNCNIRLTRNMFKRKKRHITAKQKANFNRMLSCRKQAGVAPFQKMTKAQRAKFDKLYYKK